MPTSHAIARCFDKAASTYDSYAHIQRRACRLLLQSLKSLTVSSGPIIDIGCGTGLSTQALAQYYPNQSLTGIDISSGLLQVAIQRLKNQTVILKNSDFDTSSSYHDKYTLMFSNMALQWSNNLSSTLALLKNHLQPQGVIAFSAPLPNTFIQLNYTHKQTLLPHSEIISCLDSSGFELYHTQNKHWIENHKNALAAMRSIKAIGANHTNTIAPNSNFSFVRQALGNTDAHKPFELSHEIGFYIAGLQC
ncbi:MAG: methyltransferase domain-containing protein [Coxiellaceae bacterium]|nr:methyltransferase domain-containing protein [Coxiellaceae bacterium]